MTEKLALQPKQDHFNVTDLMKRQNSRFGFGLSLE